MKFLGVDYGLQRAGVAVSDPEGTTALPLRVLHLRDFGKRSLLLDAIAACARDYGCQGMVIGLPLYENGQENLMCRQVRNVVQRLKRRLAIPIYFMPEALSSIESAQILRQIDGKHERQILDHHAACLILQSFLDQPEARRMAA